MWGVYVVLAAVRVVCWPVQPPSSNVAASSPSMRRIEAVTVESICSTVSFALVRAANPCARDYAAHADRPGARAGVGSIAVTVESRTGCRRETNP
ncbi:Uncharacterised protein [Mycobacterium tuberculosis]|uniref:Uncharacterized protein n=1 Tax=Mycobacterium tuberculosis TaxID=1773 RepID=A0A0U0QN66_MYCTX|nr:Uncharacterised protein [Mycobacterium tuberculosis]COW85340.1 Uncharacterised protein [Mycobacterium tuberculosis]